MPRTIAISLLAALLGMMIGCNNHQPGTGPTKTNAAGTNPLTWKCLWVWGLPRKTATDAAEEVRVSEALGFNAIATGGREAYVRMVVPEAHARGLEVYAVHTAPHGEWGFMKSGTIVAPQGCLQEYPPEEIKKLDSPTDPDLAVLPGPFLCIDRPEVRQYAADLAVALMGCGVDGVALDWVGYKNYRGCECAYSKAERAKFVAAHKEMSADDAATAFAIERMKAYYQAVRDAVKARYPSAKLMCHLYPPFHPGEMTVELHGNQLPVEHPVQTVAWYFRPHWPMDKVAHRCTIVKATEHSTHAYVTGTGFIGLDMAPKSLKTPQRLREELRAIKAAGLNGFCVAGGAEFLRDEPLMTVMAEELGGKPTVLRPATRPAN